MGRGMGANATVPAQETYGREHAVRQSINQARIHMQDKVTA